MGSCPRNEPSDIAALARELMAQHGLTTQGWIFEYDQAKRRAGCCFHQQKRITLSYHYVLANPLEEVRDTILHEIAHALAGHKAGHGWEWVQVCRRIGAKPIRCYDSQKVVMPKGNWKATCPSCGKTYHRHKRPRRGWTFWCTKCGREQGKLEYGREA